MKKNQLKKEKNGFRGILKKNRKEAMVGIAVGTFILLGEGIKDMVTSIMTKDLRGAIRTFIGLTLAVSVLVYFFWKLEELEKSDTRLR